MKNQFADYETSKKLKQLGFDEECFKIYCSSSNTGDNEIQLWKTETVFDTKDVSKNSELTNENSCTAPLWWQIKEWLWEKYEIRISYKIGTNGYDQDSFHGVSYAKNKDWSLAINSDGMIGCSRGFVDSPNKSEIEAIKETINHLYKNTAVAVTPINTKTNDC